MYNSSQAVAARQSIGGEQGEVVLRENAAHIKPKRDVVTVAFAPARRER